jgi:hypothetical protein
MPGRGHARGLALRRGHDRDRRGPPAFAVSATVYIQQATPAAQRGLALSAYNAGFVGSVPAGAFAVAAIASTAGVRWALIGPGLVIAVCAAALLIGGRPAGIRSPSVKPC